MIKQFRTILNSKRAVKKSNLEKEIGENNSVENSSETTLPSWNKWIEASPELWNKGLADAKNRSVILIATSVGGFAAATIVESLLAVALTLRGANIRFLLCDKFLPACMRVHAGLVKSPSVITEYKLKEAVCPSCLNQGSAFYGTTGLPIDFYSEFVSQKELASFRSLSSTIPHKQISSYTSEGLAIGEHAMAGTLRFFSKGILPEDEEAELVLRRYFESALIATRAIQGYFDKYEVNAVVFHHGIYVPQGLIGEVARSRGIRVANWQVAYRKKCFIFSHERTYHHTLLEERVDTWENIEWNDALEEQTMSYLKSRWYGSDDWIWFHENPQHDFKSIAIELGLQADKPIITLLTNVFWDAQLHYRANAFPSMLHWIYASIDHFLTRDDLQLVIRIHPAEVRGSIPSRQPIENEIKARYPKLPAHIFIVSPENQVSTYALCENSDSVLIYGTKTGVELAAMGIPVVVAGEAWIRNKGITWDVDSPNAYKAILEKLPFKHRLSEGQILRAKKYAFHFFFRRFLPMEFMEPCSSGKVPYQIKIESLEQLLPGCDAGLDVICDGILKEQPFIYPAERFIMQGKT